MSKAWLWLFAILLLGAFVWGLEQVAVGRDDLAVITVAGIAVVDQFALNVVVKLVCAFDLRALPGRLFGSVAIRRKRMARSLAADRMGIPPDFDHVAIVGINAGHAGNAVFRIEKARFLQVQLPAAQGRIMPFPGSAFLRACRDRNH